MTIVKNIKGFFSEKPNKYNSWLELWNKKRGFVAEVCMCSDCDNGDADTIAHVQEQRGNIQDKWFITPICYECNQNKEIFDVPRGLLVAIDLKD